MRGARAGGERDTLARAGAVSAAAERLRQTVGTMSGGEQQMVAIGRALMSAPDILLLDEPSLGLVAAVVHGAVSVLPRIRASGVGILLVEQNAKQSLDIADRGYLIDDRPHRWRGQRGCLEDDPAVQRAYLGAAEVLGVSHLPGSEGSGQEPHVV